MCYLPTRSLKAFLPVAKGCKGEARQRTKAEG